MRPARLFSLALVLTVFFAAPALAQVDTTPPTVTGVTADGTDLPGATLTSAPTSIVVTYSEAISATTVDTRSVVPIRNAAELGSAASSGVIDG